MTKHTPAAGYERNPDGSVTELREDGTRIVSSKHTPGPWRAVECSDGARHVATRRGNVIAHISAFALDGDRSGNARLIAAAPDLLAALEKEQEWRERDAAGALDEEWDYETMVGQYRRAAIARATGEQS